VKRKRLAELVREEAEALQEASAPKEERAEEAPPAQASPSGERPLPPYLTYVRKECRLRPDQLDALTALARRLNRERKGKGERITENTLIRLAIDIFLNQPQEVIFNALGTSGSKEL
jgi:pyruvate/2-oxoglutarate dehydrogenase complex dihydrolipoamide acyltransferase (E2) component